MHGGVDVMEVEAVLGSNNQLYPRDHTATDIRMSGIDVPALSPLPRHFPINHEGNGGMPGTPPPVAHANQGADLSPVIAWGDSKLPAEPLLSAYAMAVVANRKDSTKRSVKIVLSFLVFFVKMTFSKIAFSASEAQCHHTMNLA